MSAIEKMKTHVRKAKDFFQSVDFGDTDRVIP